MTGWTAYLGAVALSGKGMEIFAMDVFGSSGVNWKMRTEAALQAGQVAYGIGQHDFTHPIDSPSQAAIEIAKSLSFDNVRFVTVDNAIWGFVPPPGAPSSSPAIIKHLQQHCDDGWGSEKLPSICNIKMHVEVPYELETAAAANLIHNDLSSLLTAGGEN
ncbi:unnamed protein product [Vitrella brassicaformis CCMP3155]|uniref:Uncharacterized protein n=1 Tax=Vitrella brassicaformis (strain CCMP3155) TaxID=1169540 RepID=A0A0G4GZI8_VITBC|nr:unnamed protein product [Vitrella brassicaformis CCMP3155]|eukprot:CEM36440.1 unnamed protein product [Vitrella brassicaformis CCMP3155]